MEIHATVALSFLLAFQLCLAADKEVTMNDVTVKVLGKSGKVTVTRSGEDSVTMEMDKLAEYAADGTTEVGKSGSEKHSFNTFASLGFEFTTDEKLQYQGIDASGFSFKSQIRDATLSVAVTFFNADGLIVNDNEEINVTKGAVKTDITIKNWSFCNPCKQGKKEEFGQNLQLTITIKGKKDSPEMKQAGNPTKSGRTKAPVYDVGGNFNLILSKKYKDNDVWKDMASGYPKLVTVGSKKSFVFRFEKFDNTVFYDPVLSAVSYSGSGGGYSKAAGKVEASGFLITILLLITRIIIKM